MYVARPDRGRNTKVAPGVCCAIPLRLERHLPGFAPTAEGRWKTSCLFAAETSPATLSGSPTRLQIIECTPTAATGGGGKKKATRKKATKSAATKRKKGQ